MLMGQKYLVHRDVIFALVLRECGVDLTSQGTEAGVAAAVRVLDRIKAVGLGEVDGVPDT